MLGNCRAAFNPIAAVDVADAEVVVNDRMVNMAAYDAFGVVALGFSGERLLKFAEVIDRVLDLLLCPLR